MNFQHSSPTRASLLKRLREPDDGSAWREFVTLYGPLLSAWCRRRGLRDHDVDDVVQTVLLRLARRMSSFEYDASQGSFRAYLHTLARFSINDWFRERREQNPGEGGLPLDLLESVAARDDLATQLDSAFDHEVLAEAMRRAGHRVEPQTWSAFELTAMQQESCAAAAARLRMSVAGVYKARARVLVIVREELALLESDQESVIRVQARLFSGRNPDELAAGHAG
jgi:RNA polymerase sigma-70 factor, ECF subfamily